MGSPERRPRSLRGRRWFLRGVLIVFDLMDALYIHQGSYISIFKSLPSWKVFLTLGFSKASPKESNRTLVVPERIFGGVRYNGCP
jgi:hypothetical protein